MASQYDRNERARSRATGRPALDPGTRLHIHGPIQPMERPGLLQRLLGLR